MCFSNMSFKSLSLVAKWKLSLHLKGDILEPVTALKRKPSLLITSDLYRIEKLHEKDEVTVLVFALCARNSKFIPSCAKNVRNFNNCQNFNSYYFAKAKNRTKT